MTRVCVYMMIMILSLLVDLKIELDNGLNFALHTHTASWYK